jgi:hypothetical protein
MARLIGGLPANVKATDIGRGAIDPLPQQSHNRGGKFSRISAEGRSGERGIFHMRRDQQMDRGRGHRSQRAIRLLAIAGAMAAALSFSFADAFAQGWWPWSQQEPRPREPMRPGGPGAPGGPSGPGGPGQAPYQQGPNQNQGQQPGFGPRASNSMCQQLEQRLVAETQGGAQNRDQLPRIESDMRTLDRNYQQAQAGLSRGDCYDQFLFTKTLRNTPRCVQMYNEVENIKRQLADLDAQRRQIMGTRDRSFQDDIIRELARNGCGGQYSQEARRRDSAKNPFSMLWGEESSEPPRGGNQFGNLPFATYRTVCVRLCDGYYFPVSFSTLPNHFQRDSELCQSQCAAPADLYYHQNPGGAVEQMVSANTQQPYTSLKTAWRYRKEFVQGCSCKEAEYNPQQTGDRKAEAPATPVGKGSTARLDPR